MSFRPLRRWLEEVWEAQPDAPPAGAVLLDPLERLYRWGAMRRRPRPRRGPIPVVSVGSLWAGGGGKTPLAAELARLADQEGLGPALVLRGYGGRAGRRRALRVASPPPREGAVLYGDEACLHARDPAVPVYVARRRLEGVARAAQEGCRLAILDDGMQHRQLARDLEIVTLPAERPLGNGRLLPRGPLREPAEALGRADLIVLSHTPRSGPEASFLDRAEHLAPEVPILSWRAELTLKPWVAVGEASAPLEKGAPVGILCGIGRPRRFRRAIEEVGHPVAWVDAFADHHRYAARQIDAVRARAERDRLAAVVTTEKDAVRIGSLRGVRLSGLHVAVLRLVWREDEARASLRRMLRAAAEG